MKDTKGTVQKVEKEKPVLGLRSYRKYRSKLPSEWLKKLMEQQRPNSPFRNEK